MISKDYENFKYTKVVNRGSTDKTIEKRKRQKDKPRSI
jgi:hypothetical protein